MSKSIFYYVFLVIYLTGNIQFKSAAQSGNSKELLEKPNILFIISDQQSFDMLGCYGNNQIITPNLDKLATEGIRFNQCISNSPQCTPYRAMLLTGQHPVRTGGFNNDIQVLSSEEAGCKGEYFGEVLRDNGYKMGYIGKWHLYGGDRNRPIPAGSYRYGFDDVFLSNNCTLQFDSSEAYYWDENGIKTFYRDWEPYGQAKQAIDFIKTYSDHPFALFVSFHPPHDWGGKYGAPEDLLSLYNPDGIRLRQNCEDTRQNRLNYQGHMAMITSLDIAIGRILYKLKEENLDQNTLVVFTSDHGDMLMSHYWPNNKGRPENESLHVPLVMRWPSILKPGISELLFSTLDFMPTILSMLHIRVPMHCQGQNLSEPIFKQQNDFVAYVPIFNYHHDWRGVYTRQFTYSFSTDKKHEDFYMNSVGKSFHRNCLYDKFNDPLENINLYDSASFKKLRDSLHTLTLQWMKELGEVDMMNAEIFRKTIIPEKQNKPWYLGEGKLRGRPVDFLQ